MDWYQFLPVARGVPCVPVLPREELLSELANGVVFYGYEADGSLAAVMRARIEGLVKIEMEEFARSSTVETACRTLSQKLSQYPM